MICKPCRKAADNNKPKMHKKCDDITHKHAYRSCCCLHRVNERVESNGNVPR
jgi:hypothetical protein